MNRPDDITGLPVLDRERWDAEADLALGARAIDLTVVRAGAATQRRSHRTAWAGLAAAAAVAGLLAVALGPWGSRLLSAPVPPASAPTGLPDRIWSPPLWIPSVTEAPIGRVAAVVTAPVTGGGWTRSAGTGLVLVSDDSQYRTVPDKDGTAVSVSKDGRHVAWTVRQSDARTSAGSPRRAVVHWVDVRTGRAGEADLSIDGRPSDVNVTAWSADGRWLGVALTYEKPGSTAKLTQVGGALALVDARSGRVHRLCTGCSNQIGFDAFGRVLLPSGTPATIPAGLDQGLLPAGTESVTTLPQPTALLDGTSATPVYVNKKDSATLGQPDQWWVVRTDPDGSTHRIPVPGTHVSVDLLTLAGSDVLVRVGDQVLLRGNGETVDRYTVQRMPIDGPDGRAPTVTEVLRYAGGVTGSGGGEGADFSVLAVSTDLAATGRQVPGVAPSTPWWQPSHVRWVVAGHPALSSLLPGLAVLAFILFALYRGAQGVRRRVGWRRERLAAERAGAGQPAGETIEG